MARLRCRATLIEDDFRETIDSFRWASDGADATDPRAMHAEYAALVRPRGHDKHVVASPSAARGAVVSSSTSTQEVASVPGPRSQGAILMPTPPRAVGAAAPGMGSIPRPPLKHSDLYDVAGAFQKVDSHCGRLGMVAQQGPKSSQPRAGTSLVQQWLGAASRESDAPSMKTSGGVHGSIDTSPGWVPLVRRRDQPSHVVATPAAAPPEGDPSASPSRGRVTFCAECGAVNVVAVGDADESVPCRRCGLLLSNGDNVGVASAEMQTAAPSVGITRARSNESDEEAQHRQFRDAVMAWRHSSGGHAPTSSSRPVNEEDLSSGGDDRAGRRSHCSRE